MNSRFPLLSFVSLVMRFVGWTLVLVGSYFGVWEGMIEPNLPNHRFTIPGDLEQLLGGVLALWFGLVAVVMGEVIGVLFAIEANTRPQLALTALSPRQISEYVRS